METKEEEKCDNINEEKKSIEEKKDIITEEKKENNNEYNDKSIDKKQVLQDKLKKIFFEREQNKYKYNKINLPDNLKYSSDNSNSSVDFKNNDNKMEEGKKEKVDTNNDDIKNEKNIEENKNINDINNIEDNIINIDENKNTIVKHPSKNYVIKKPPERKKNRVNEEELTNKKYVLGFVNNKKNNLSKNEEKSNDNIENPENTKVQNNNKDNINNNIGDNKDNNDNKNLISTKNDEDQNKILYRQLMAKKCQNIIKLENDKNNEKLMVNNIKLIKEGKNKIEENLIIPKINDENEDKKRSKTINTNKNTEKFSIKEGTLKILQLIKAKKNEKNLIDEKMKETKNNLKEDDMNKKLHLEKGLENDNLKNDSSLIKKETTENIIKQDEKDIEKKIMDEKTEKELKNNNTIINDNIDNKNEIIKDIITSEENLKENDTRKIIKDIKVNSTTIKNDKSDLINKKQIYKKFKGKGKSYLIGNNNNFLSITNNIEKEITEKNSIPQENQEKTKLIERNKINRHHTSLNVSKKNYILKPKKLELFEKDNNINNANNIIRQGDNYNNNYEKNKTFQNQKDIKINNHIYEPKKGLIINNNKKLYGERSLKLNMDNKSPMNIKADKMTYVKKSYVNNNSDRRIHKLNNSLGNISPFINDNYNLGTIIRNNMNTQVDYLKFNNNNNLNSSFKLANELGKTYYNIGNIFNLDNFEEDNNINLSNNFNINFNLDSLYNINYPIKKNKIKPSAGYNTFYSNNYFAENNNVFNRGDNNYTLNNKYNNNFNYNRNKIRINNIFNQYKNNSITNNSKKIQEKNNNIIKVKNNFLNDFFNSLKYEDLLILEDKFNNIMISLNEEKIISNDCFEFWNYFFNNSLYENLNIFYSNYDNEYKNMFKMSINYILISIMLSYDISFEKKKLEKINPLLREMLEFTNKLLIIIYEYILNVIPFTKNNTWINKILKIIQKSKLLDDSDSFLVEPEKITEKEKLNLNINFLSKKIYYILTNYPSKNSQNILTNFFKNKFRDEILEDVNKFFLESIFREKDYKYSILGFSFLKNGGKITTPNPPFLKIKKSKKYYLVFDIDETLFHFKISEEDEEQGVLKIRPGVFQLIEEIRQYYQIILFSEADKDYVDLIIEALGNKRYLFDYILSRDYISIEKNDFIKDISKIGIPLSKIIIIDNMPQNFRKNKENAIYIKSFFGDENDDKALIYLIPILVNIAKSGKDVRKELIKYKEKIVTTISSNIYKNDN